MVAGLIAIPIGIAKARSAASTGSHKLHSRLGYYGSFLAISTALPALILTFFWSWAQPTAITSLVRSELPENVVAQRSSAEIDLFMGQVRTIAEGLPKLSVEEFENVKKSRLGFSTPDTAMTVLQNRGIVLGSPPPKFMIDAAYDFVAYQQWGSWVLTGLAAIFAIGGFLFGLSRIGPRMRARNLVETVVLGAMIAASTVAILTTVGIVFSVVFETIHFFQKVSPQNFFFGTVWDPRFSSADANRGEGQFGFLPLLWGTLYISFIALLVAVPVGLYSAIYLSEYAGPKVRAVAKPVLEILAGIPTIVYGLFALIAFGPFLQSLGQALYFDISSRSVLTAGIVMGIMLIPFVSSLSDDIISAVPQSLRDGSLGLGATKSETIRRVILPAALPGVVGAVLLAASRAIGETMIVVLAAGVSASLSLSPFEPVTTMTVKIVSQLTGDLEFTSPQTQVAFALGFTLFFMTLLLNIYALYIVRKYKEQYE